MYNGYRTRCTFQKIFPIHVQENHERKSSVLNSQSLQKIFVNDCRTDVLFDIYYTFLCKGSSNTQHFASKGPNLQKTKINQHFDRRFIQSHDVSLKRPIIFGNQKIHDHFTSVHFQYRTQNVIKGFSSNRLNYCSSEMLIYRMEYTIFYFSARLRWFDN